MIKYKLAAGRRNTCGTPIAFGEGEVKSRVKNVLHYRKPAAWAVAVIAVLCLALAFGLLVNRADEKVNLEDAIAEDLETISKSLYVDSPMKTKVQLSDKAREYLEALYSQERELNEKYHMIHANYKATVTLVEKREDRQWIFLDYQVLSTWNYANAGKPQDMDSAASVLASVIYDTKEEQIVEIEGLDFFNPLRS